MDKERFEVFGNVIKDNEDIPSLLNDYQATVRLNELNDKVKELEQELAKYKELQDRLGLENADEFEWFVMLDLLTDNEKNMQILDLNRELAELKEKAIVPRFKKGDTAYAIIDTTFYTDVFKVNILDTEICYRVDRGDNDISTQHHTRLFTTEQEAQEKLKELKNG